MHRVFLEKIKVEKEGEERFYSVPEFEALSGAAFIPQLEFDHFSTFQDIVQRLQKAHKKKAISREQMWRGSYYKNEILTSYFPKVSIRWINESVGWGVFAEKTFKQMEFVAQYSGRVRKRVREDRKNAYGFEYLAAPFVPTPYVIDAQDQGGLARFINHSSRPNLHSLLATLDWVNYVIFIAAEPIPKGAQLFFDYGPDYWSARIRALDLRKKAE